MPLIRNPGCVKGSYSARFLRQAERCTLLPPSLPPLPSLPSDTPQRTLELFHMSGMSIKNQAGEPFPSFLQHSLHQSNAAIYFVMLGGIIEYLQDELTSTKTQIISKKSGMLIALKEITLKLHCKKRNYWQSLNVTTQSLQQLHCTEFL